MRMMLPAVAVAVAVVSLLSGASAMAQAWLPAKGSISAGITYTDTFNRDHYLPDGTSIDVGHTRTHATAVDVSWSPSDRWTLAAALPYVRAEYHGSRPHVGTDIDDGDERGYFTDLRIDAHYQWRLRPVALAPYVALVIPTHHYPALGHASPGRHLHERLLGIYIGRSLDYWLPRSYVQLRLQYGMVEPVADVGHDRSNIDLEVGHFLTPRWSVRLLGAWQRTHGGIDVPVPPTHPLYLYHDQLASERYVQLGAGLAFAPRPADNVFLTWRRSVKGINGHKLDNGFALGISHSLR